MSDGTAACFLKEWVMLHVPFVLGDGVVWLEFHSKGNTLDGNTLSVAEEAFRIIPGRYNGLVVGNQGKHFSFGANLRRLLALLNGIGSDRARFHAAAKRFQRFTTGMRTASFRRFVHHSNLPSAERRN
jgi:3-hydroxyacyl-CoA dehydrogenase